MVLHAPARPRTVTLTIDGVQVTVRDGTTIWTAAKEAGFDIPVLCHDERYDPVGVCRMCVVDTGARVYAAACVRPRVGHVQPGHRGRSRRMHPLRPLRPGLR